jgi:P-type Ca2+ transporter type 2C
MKEMTATRAQGLSSSEAEARLLRAGPNRVELQGRLSVWSSMATQLRDPLILVLLGAAVLTVATGDFVDAIVIGIVVVANSTVGVAQELRADRAITALAGLAAPTVRVRRDGTEITVESAMVVPGDVVLLGEGDVVPADAVILEAASLLVDESALTGESVPEAKAAAAADDPRGTVSAGTVVIRGRGVVETTRTGANSALGRIAELMDSRVQVTPLQRRLAGLGRVLAAGAVALSAFVLLAGLARGEPTELMLVAAISLAVAAVPESLPAVITLSLALGARRMAERKAIVRRLAAVETLGSVTILATDKTGTLTRGTMVVSEIWTPHRRVALTSRGFEPVGEGAPDSSGVDLIEAPDLRDVLVAATLCNDARVMGLAGDEGSGLGDPTEVALLAAAARLGLTREDLEQRLPRVLEVPFDSDSQRMTTVHSDGASFLVAAKGSPEALIGPARLDRQERDRWLERSAELAARGYRVLAVTTARAAEARAEVLDQPATISGLVALADPLRPSAAPTISSCRAAGITPVLVTGDHPATARAIAAEVGIVETPNAQVVTGRQLRRHEVTALTVPRVFARTAPDQKLGIVEAWKASGEIVAMTGDGVNDGPALRRADIGVAMGGRGTEVARQAADLVLADDELHTVVAAVEEGRRVYANIRRFLVFGLSGGAAAIVVMLFGPLVGLPVPLLAAQILWINLLTHGLTGVAIGAEPSEPGAMTRPPQPPDQSVIGSGLWQRVVRLTLFVAAVSFTVALLGHPTDRQSQTTLFLALTSAELGVAMGLRPEPGTTRNLLLPMCVAVSLGLALAGVYVPFLRDLLETVVVPWPMTVAAIGAGVLGCAGALVDRRIFS